VVGVRPGSSGGKFKSPATVPPPPTETTLPPSTRATAPNAGVSPLSPACGASVTRLEPGISDGREPPSSGEAEEDPRAMEQGPADRSDVLCHGTAIQPTRVFGLMYRKWCRSATRAVCVQRVSPGAPKVVRQSGGLPHKEGSNGRLSYSRDTRYGTRGPGSGADRDAKTGGHGLIAGDDGAYHRRRPSSSLGGNRCSGSIPRIGKDPGSHQPMQVIPSMHIKSPEAIMTDVGE